MNEKQTETEMADQRWGITPAGREALAAKPLGRPRHTPEGERYQVTRVKSAGYPPWGVWDTTTTIVESYHNTREWAEQGARILNAWVRETRPASSRVDDYDEAPDANEIRSAYP
jgi:hypothetical protein